MRINTTDTYNRVMECGNAYKSTFNDALTSVVAGECEGIRSGLRKLIADLRRDKDKLPYLSSIDLERYINDTIREMEDLL